MGEEQKQQFSAHFPSPLEPAEWKEIAERLHLTPRQTQVVELILCGMSDKQIAGALGMSIRTVREHLSHLFIRLGVKDRMELVLHIFSASRAPRRK